MELTLTPHIAPLARTFAISRGAKTEARTVIVSLQQSGLIGRGECVPYARYDETVTSVMQAIEAIRPQLASGLKRTDLQTLMPAGAARCAVDCALWDLEAKLTKIPVWQLAGLPEPRPVETAVTVSLDTPDNMGRAAKDTQGRLLKLKLGGDKDIARLEAVHKARPDARLILDGNEGLLPSGFPGFTTRAAELGVVLIEQPFPAGNDTDLVRLTSKVTICADESAHTSANIEVLARRYGAVNIKLDKAGGLTEAIRMVYAARAANLKVMIGCMVAGSLSMAPAVLLAGLADIVDLDGPLWLAEDIANGLVYENGYIGVPVPALWG